jgi:O-antigen/teichoic acid export membrane protein
MSTAISDPAAGQQAAPAKSAPDRPEPSLRANFGWTFSSNAFYAACQWGMLSVLAKAGSPAIVGEFALGLAITAPVFMFTNLQLRAVKATDARSDFEFADYFTLRVLASLAGLLFVAAVAWLLPYDRGTRTVVLLVGVSKFVESLSDVIAGLLQKHERLDQVAISLFIRGVLSVAGFAATFLRTHSVVAAVVALVLAWTAVFVFYDVGRAVSLVRHGSGFFRFSVDELRKLLIVSAPLGVVMTLISLNTNIPRYMLVKYLGEADLGIFASMAYMLVALSLIVNALGQSAVARLARMFAAGDIYGFKKVMRKLMFFGASILVLAPLLAAFVGRPLLILLYRPEYGQNTRVFVVMMLTGGFTTLASFLGFGATAVRSFRTQVPVVGLATLTAGALSFLLVPRFGLMGAAEALLVSAIVLALGYALTLHKALRRSEVR